MIIFDVCRGNLMDSQLATNIISGVVALATLVAVLMAIVAIRDNRKQAQQTQYNSSHPLLVPEGAPKF